MGRASGKGLTEQELIEVMEKNGIGTDATIAEHIKTIQERLYVEKKGSDFHPTRLGEALVEGYETAGIDLWKPLLRRIMEENMTEIAKGKMKKEVFLEGCLKEMEGIFMELKGKQEVLLQVVGKYFKGLKPAVGEVKVEEIVIDPAEYKIINDEDGMCGNCNGRTIKVMENNEGSRIARCTVDNISLKLPKKGAMRFKEEINCPLCSFQLLELKSEGNQRYTICPWCYSNPPEALLGDIEGGNTLMPCFKCPNIDCKASGAAGDEKALFVCEKCKTSGMVIRRAKNGKLFLGCKGFPHCKYLIPVPEIIKDIEIMEGEKCKKCPGNVTKARVKFQEKQNLESNLRMRICEEDSVFCFGGCDIDLETLGYTVKKAENRLEIASPVGNSQTRTNASTSASTSASTRVRASFSSSNYSQSSVKGYLERYSERTGKDILSESSPGNEAQGIPSTSSGVRRSDTHPNYLAKVQCFKCREYGHYAKECTIKTRKSDEKKKDNKDGDIRKYLDFGKVEKKKDDVGKGEKYCVGCGRLGKHPKGSDCVMVRKKQMKLGK